MSDNTSNQNSLIPIIANGLIKASNSIEITDKILSVSKYEFDNDFKGEEIWKFNAHSQTNSIIALGYDYKNEFTFLISAGEDGLIKTWDVGSVNFQCISSLEIQIDTINAILIFNNSPSKEHTNEHLAFLGDGSSDGKLYRLKIDLAGNLTEKMEFGNIEGGIKCITSNNKIIAVGAENAIQIYDPIKLTLLQKIEVDYDTSRSLAFLESNDIVLTGQGSIIKAWDIFSGKEIFSLPGTKHSLSRFSYCRQKNILACIENKIVRIWDIEKRKCQFTITDNLTDFWDLSFSSNGNYLAAISIDSPSTIKVYDSKSYNMICEYKGHLRWINSLLFSKDSKEIFSTDSQGFIHKWK